MSKSFRAILRNLMLLTVPVLLATSCIKYDKETHRPVFDVKKAKAIDKNKGIYEMNDVLFYYDEVNDMVFRIPEDFTYDVSAEKVAFYSPDSVITVNLGVKNEGVPQNMTARNFMRSQFEAIPSDTKIILQELNDSVISGKGSYLGTDFFEKWYYTVDKNGSATVKSLRYDYFPVEYVKEAAAAIFPTSVAPFPNTTIADRAEEEHDWI